MSGREAQAFEFVRPPAAQVESARCTHCGVAVDVAQRGAACRRKDDKWTFYCPKHALRARPQKPRPKRPFKLTRQERSDLIAGNSPRITREKAPSIELPYVHPVTPLLSIEITRATKKLEQGKWRWVLRYTLLDQGRDVTRLLRRRPHPIDFDAIRESFDEHGFPKPIDDEVRAEAAEESAYTSGGHGAITDAGEAVPRGWDNVLRMRAKERKRTTDEEEHAEELARRQARAITESTRQMLIMGARHGVDVSPHVATIQRAIDRASEEIAEAA